MIQSAILLSTQNKLKLFVFLLNNQRINVTFARGRVPKNDHLTKSHGLPNRSGKIKAGRSEGLHLYAVLSM